MSKDKDVYFKKLSPQEKKSKLALLPKSKKKVITIWEKGQVERYQLDVEDYFRTKNEFKTSGNLDDGMKGKTLLCTFDLNGLHFFGQCKVVSNNMNIIFLDMDEDLFKSERRNNFRLLTYPHHKVYISIKVGKEEIEKNNVINMQTKVSESTLFKNFLHIIDGEENSREDNYEDYIEFRVIDVSVTGLAFQFSELEKSFFKEINTELGQMSKVLYTLDFFKNRNLI